MNRIFRGLPCALATAIYVGGVAFLLSNIEAIFTDISSPVFPITFMLLLFITSATITSSFVIGTPLHLYFSGKSKEGFLLLFSTVGWLILIILVILLLLANY